MLMAVKYQILLCKSGHEVLMLTLSHLDSVRSLVSSSPQHIEMVNKTCTKFIKTYKDFNPSQLALIRHTILNCIQDYYKKVQVHFPKTLSYCLSLSLSVSGICVPCTKYPAENWKVCSTNRWSCPIWFRASRQSCLPLQGVR